MSKTLSRQTAELLFEIKAITLKPGKPFRFSSGILSPIYIDNRIIMSYPKQRKKITGFYIKFLQEKVGLEKIDVLSGTATAAIPYAAFIAQKLNLPMVYVRSEKKNHGRKNQIEGYLNKGQKVVIIEDHISTGGSLIANAKAVRKAKCRVKYALATTTYSLTAAKKIFKSARIKVFALTDFREIIETAVDNGFLKPQERQIVLEWCKNPKKWGEEFKFI